MFAILNNGKHGLTRCMRRLLTYFVLLGLLLVGLMPSTLAVDTNQKRSATAPNQLDMPFLIAPASQGDALVGFHYISYRLITPSSADVALIKTKLAFIQDAYVRDVYKTPVYNTQMPTQLDQTVLKERLLTIARRFVGAKHITDLIFLDAKFAPLHPVPGNGIFTPPGSDSGNGNREGQERKAGEPATMQPQKEQKR